MTSRAAPRKPNTCTEACVVPLKPRGVDPTHGPRATRAQRRPEVGEAGAVAWLGRHRMLCACLPGSACSFVSCSRPSRHSRTTMLPGSPWW